MSNFQIPYIVPTNYTYNDCAIEIVNGIARLKNCVSMDETFYVNYNTNINGNRGGGVLTGTPVGGASVSGGKLDLTHNDIRYVDYNANLNADSQQTGCIRFKYTPNYNGANSTEQSILSISKSHNDVKNYIYLRHRLGGIAGQYLVLHMYDKDGVYIKEQVLEFWVAIQGQEYEFELNWDLTTGATRFFRDGIQRGITITETGLRDSNIGLLRMGSNYKAQYTSNFKIDDLQIFSTVQHTSNYTPCSCAESTYCCLSPTIYKTLGNGVANIEEWISFTETLGLGNEGSIRYQLSDNGIVWKYWNGTIWDNVIPTDETFYVNYNTNINGNRGGGVLTGTPVGGASVSGGKLDLTHNDIRYVDYNANLNADSQQTGCIRFKYTPNYTGGPSVQFFPINILKAHNVRINQITIMQLGDGAIYFYITDKDGNYIVNTNLGSYPVILGQTYEFEINYDITNGESRIFINGTQLGATQNGTGLRDSNIGLLRVGTNRNAISPSNYKIDDLQIFSTVQHTSNYIPLENYNTVAECNAHMLDFPATLDKIYVKPFLVSNGEQKVELDLNEVGYVINTAPYVYAGTNKVAVYNTPIHSFSDCLFSDAEGNIIKAEWKEEGGTYTEIVQGAYSSLLDAVQAFSDTFTHSGNKNVYLKITDTYISSEDILIVNVNRVATTINVKNNKGSQLSNITFNPGDGTGATLKNSAFTHNYYIGSHTATFVRNGFVDESQSVTITILSDTINQIMTRKKTINELIFNVDAPRKYFLSDSFFLDCIIDENLTDYKIRCEVSDNNRNKIKLATSNSGGSIDEIDIIDAVNGEFLIKVAKDLTVNFNKKSFIEIEIENLDGEVRTIFKKEIEFNEERIDWTSSS